MLAGDLAAAEALLPQERPYELPPEVAARVGISAAPEGAAGGRTARPGGS